MTEKRMLIVPAELIKKIDANRGDMTQADFINFLIDNHLGQNTGEQRTGEQHYVTKETLNEFEHGIKELLRNFLEFVVSYGLELGKQPTKGDVEEISRRLREI